MPSRPSSSPSSAYRAHVPAVARAVQALEHLAAAQQPLSLSALSRAIAAARYGVQPLRYVAPLGLRLPASGWASRTLDGIIEGELEPGVWMLAISLDDRALLAVVGPQSRLRAAAGAEARRALKEAAG